MRKRFLLIDDHSIVRSALKLVIRQKHRNALIDECSHGAEAIKKAQVSAYDVIIVDLNIPQTDAPKLIQQLQELRPTTKLLIFTILPEAIFASRYFQLGVQGFLNKDCDEAEVSLAIETVLSGRRYLSARLSSKLLASNFTIRFQNPMEALSAREKQIVKLLVTGQTHGEIKRTLGIKHSTVGTYKHRIFQKLGVTNIVDLKEIANLYL
ncbi:MAG TPA: response regulator transcription factor [Chitinophagaceae bacterium]|nr:response regulator transcription factor [Chitinophagaceae bacterium]